MPDLTLRQEKGSSLTYQEMDNNLINLLLPAGVITSFGGINIPDGWLKCDGSLISRTEYIRLFNAIGELYGIGDGSTTFKLPDLRGEFIRGFDDGRGIDINRQIGSFQAATWINRIVGDSWSLVYGNEDTNVSTTSQRIATGSYSTRTDNMKMTIRPRNIALYYIIKY